MTMSQQGRAEGREYVTVPVGTQPAIVPPLTFVLPRKEKLFRWNPSTGEPLSKGRPHLGETAVLDKCSHNLCICYLY